MRSRPKLVKVVDSERGTEDKDAAAPGIAEVPPPSEKHDVPPQPPAFAMSLRGIYQSAAEARVFDGESARVVVERVLAADVSELDEPVMTWLDGDELAAVDLDRPESAPPLTDLDVPSFFPNDAPLPLAAWVTHGWGLRALFIKNRGMNNKDISARAQVGVCAQPIPAGSCSRHR